MKPQNPFPSFFADKFLFEIQNETLIDFCIPLVTEYCYHDNKVSILSKEEKEEERSQDV